MKKTKKIMAILLMVMLIVAFATTTFAANYADPGNTDGSSSNVNTQKITSIGNSAVRIVTTIGMVASVVVLVVLGIKYMLGSAEEKAEYKKTLLPYVIGAVLVFAAAAIASMVFQFASSI